MSSHADVPGQPLAQQFLSSDFVGDLLSVSDQLHTVSQGFQALDMLLLLSNVPPHDCRPLLSALNVSFSTLLDKLQALSESVSHDRA